MKDAIGIPGAIQKDIEIDGVVIPDVWIATRDGVVFDYRVEAAHKAFLLAQNGPAMSVPVNEAGVPLE